MDRRDKVRPLLDDLDADAVLVVALRDPQDGPEGASMRQQSVIAVSRDKALSAKLLEPLGNRVLDLLRHAFEGAGIVTDFVRRD